MNLRTEQSESLAEGEDGQSQSGRRGAKPRNDLLWMWVIRLAIVGAIIGTWQFVAVRELVNPVFSGTPSKIAVEFIDVITGTVLTEDLPTTLFETLLGFVLGAVVGFLLGAMFTQLPLLRRATTPILSALNSLPRVALAPLFIIWFGLGMASKVALSFSLVVFIMLLNTEAGLMNSDQDTELLARSLGAKGLRRIWYFVLPGAVPVLVAGLELSLIYSFLGAVVAELMGGYRGLGVVLSRDANTFDVDHFFAVLLLLTIVATLLTQALRIAERRLVFWHEIETGATRSSGVPSAAG